MPEKEKKPILYLKEGERHPKQKKKKGNKNSWNEYIQLHNGGNWSKVADQGRNHGRK